MRFEASRKRAREAAGKELEGARAAEADRAALTLAEHARELREVGDDGKSRFLWRSNMVFFWGRGRGGEGIKNFG